jgi:hypothetical protein
MVTTRPDLGWSRFDLVEDLSFIVLSDCQSQIDFVAVCGSWLGFYYQLRTYVASISHIYLEILI